jgi:hypothetical protein
VCAAERRALGRGLVVLGSLGVRASVGVAAAARVWGHLRVSAVYVVLTMGSIPWRQTVLVVIVSRPSGIMPANDHIKAVSNP